MSVEPDEFESPYSTNEEAVAGSAALADSELPESSDDEDTAGIASAHGGGAAAAAGAGAGRQIATARREMLPDHVYALLNVTGDEGCCHTGGQELDMPEQTYATAKEAIADVMNVYRQDPEDEWAGPFETDDRHTPGLEKGHLLFQPYSVNLQLLKFSLQDIKAALKQDPSSMKDQNYVYCLLECETDEGQPMFPMASYRQEVFADARGAARAVHEFWGIEDLEERAKDQEEGGYVDEDFGDYTQKWIEGYSNRSGCAMLLHTYHRGIYLRKLILPKLALLSPAPGI